MGRTPFDQAIVAGDAVAAAEVGLAALVQAGHHVEVPLQGQGQEAVGAVQAIDQQNVAAMQRTQRVRSKAFSPVSFPAYGPTAISHNRPVASDSKTTIRTMGNPSPGCWAVFWGYTRWLAGVAAR